MLQVHQRLGDFEIVRLLGKGGMGEVYEAQQDRPRRRVALKVLAPWLVQDEEGLKRFWREAEVPAQLDHPGIVRIISTGHEQGIAYYTMQLVQGISLAELIQQTRHDCPPTIPRAAPAEHTPSLPGGPTTPHGEAVVPHPDEPVFGLCLHYQHDRYHTLARIGVMVARALAYAHSRGCVHRDLKPSNLMIDRHDQAYVMDFGLTRALEPDGVRTATGAISGTPWYMSPEQARGEILDHRTDIYSLGVTLYELATRGSGPYAASREVREVVLSHVRGGQHLPLRSQAPDIPPALERIIVKAMHYRPQRRYADAGEMARDLEAFLGQAPAARAGSGHRSRRWSRPLLMAGALPLVVLVALAAAFLFGGLGRNGPLSGRTPEVAEGPPGQAPGQEEDAVPPDYPEQLRKRMWGVPQSLFTLEHQPVWHRRLAGSGQFRRGPFQLILSSLGDFPTLLALDDDPERRWFNFSIELTAPLEEPGKNKVGVFFGLRKNTSRFFAVEIDEHPAPSCPHGLARMDVWQVTEGTGADGGGRGSRRVPLGKGEIPLLQSRAWHPLTVRVFEDRITVTVDGKQTSSFTMDWLAEVAPDALPLNPRGALGIWAHNGLFASFRNAYVAALPSEKKGGGN